MSCLPVLSRPELTQHLSQRPVGKVQRNTSGPALSSLKSSPFAGFSDVVRGTIHLYYELFTGDYETYETKQIYKSISQITTKRASVMTSKVFGKPSKKKDEQWCDHQYMATPKPIFTPFSHLSRLARHWHKAGATNRPYFRTVGRRRT